MNLSNSTSFMGASSNAYEYDRRLYPLIETLRKPFDANRPPRLPERLWREILASSPNPSRTTRTTTGLSVAIGCERAPPKTGYEETESPHAQGLRSCFENVASAGGARRAAVTKSSGTILNSVKLAPKGRAPRMGRVTTAVYKRVHEDSEPPRNAAQPSAVVFKTASKGEGAMRFACLAQTSLDPPD